MQSIRLIDSSSSEKKDNTQVEIWTEKTWKFLAWIISIQIKPLFKLNMRNIVRPSGEGKKIFKDKEIWERIGPQKK